MSLTPFLHLFASYYILVILLVDLVEFKDVLFGLTLQVYQQLAYSIIVIRMLLQVHLVPLVIILLFSQLL